MSMTVGGKVSRNAEGMASKSAEDTMSTKNVIKPVIDLDLVSV